MKSCRKSFWWVLAMIVTVSGITAYVGAENSRGAVARQGFVEPVALAAHLVQDKIHKGSDGTVSVALTLSADDIKAADRLPVQSVDLVLVLDRSGSMSGQKITDARQAVTQLIDRLTVNDRLALVTYSNGVETVAPLMPMDHPHRRQLKAAVSRIYTGGGTNLGGGLQGGIDTLMRVPADGRQRKVILISDGLANHGITDPNTLGQIAARASEHQLAISTLGVGYDFNEVLMTTIADHGAGSYYFLEDPQHIAQIFKHAFQTTRNVAASNVEIRIPLKNGVRLVHAGGYPITIKDKVAVFHPGDLQAGQQRKLFLTFQVPTHKEQTLGLGTFDMAFIHNGRSGRINSGTELAVACVSDPKAVTASIDKKAWEGQVLQESFGKLKEEVAKAIRTGKKDRALAHIQEYETRNRAVNAAVGSSVIADNLDSDVQELRKSVERTFTGPAAAVAEKKKQSAKALQYESYKARRDKK